MAQACPVGRCQTRVSSNAAKTNVVVDVPRSIARSALDNDDLRRRRCSREIKDRFADDVERDGEGPVSVGSIGNIFVLDLEARKSVNGASVICLFWNLIAARGWSNQRRWSDDLLFG